MGLKFKDIGKEWKPTSISIVDKPSHPLAVFEVYEDDDEFIKKYSPNDEVDKLSNTKEEEVVNDETVTMSSSFFERLFRGLVSKAEEPPKEPPVKEGEEGKEDKLDEIIKRLDAFDERIKKLENPEDPAPGAVAKSEGTAGDGGEGQGEGEGGETTTATEGREGEEGEEKPIVDDKTMVKKSKEVDPDLNKGTTTTESLMKRIGRSEDGMKW